MLATSPAVLKAVLHAGSLAPPQSVPFGSRTLYLGSQFAAMVLKNWAGCWAHGDPYAFSRSWLHLTWIVVIRAVRTVDALSDMGLVAILYYSWESRTCSWDGQENCYLYAQLTVAAALAAGLDYLLSCILAFSVAAQSGRLHVGIHAVSLLCEVALLTLTVLIGQHKATAQLHSNGTEAFLVASGSLSVFTFLANVLGMRNLMQLLLGSPEKAGQSAEVAEEEPCMTLEAASRGLVGNAGYPFKLLPLESFQRLTASVMPTAASTDSEGLHPSAEPSTRA